MKRMYWRPQRVSRTALVLIAFGSISGFLGLRFVASETRQPHYAEKLAAAKVAARAFDTIRLARLERGLPIDPEADTANTGLIGSLVTPVTSNPGSMIAKQTSVNPNFAAVAVQFLRDAGLEQGDVIAVGFSGSFPAFNACVLAAIETLGLKPIIIASAASSQWGANDPDFLWIDMQRLLIEKGVVTSTVMAASIGGIEDRGLGLTKRGRRLITESIDRQHIRRIDPVDLTDGVDKRMALFHRFAGNARIAAYVNVGGGTVSVGRRHGKRQFEPGVNRGVRSGAYPIDSVMGRFAAEGVPVVHLVKSEKMAEIYGFPAPPVTQPRPGEGFIFTHRRVSPWAIAALLAAILASLYLFVRSDLGFRMTRSRRAGSDKSGAPEPMI